MSLNMKTLTQALAKTAAVIEKTVQTTVQEVAGPKALQDYDLMDQIGSAGPGLAWRLYSAKAARDSSRQHQYSTVCVWVLDKKALTEARTRAGLSKAAEDSFLDVIRADASRLVRLRHPGVVHVVQALDDSKNAMTMVTEPLFSSVANALGNLENIAKVPKELNGMEMSLLEVKHGLLQIAESLEFVHNNANLIHRAISPENILITSNGAWKICGFGFAISKDQASGDSSYIQPFHYSDYDVEDSVLPSQPSINYTAPELVRSKTNSVGTFSDIFSFGCLAYHLIVRKPLFDCKNNVKMYMNSLTYLSSNAFSSIPSELVADLQKMLSANESLRPSALEFTGSPFFRNDTRLRALRFLDHMLGRDNMQKTEFLKALADMWKDFDARVLRYKVLPPLCAELRNLVMQPMILPMVLTIAESQDKNDFEVSTFPDLIPVLSNASGETLLLLMKHSEFIINKSCQENLISHILPLFVRAYDDTDPRIQEEALKKSVSLSKHVDLQKVKQCILPQVHAMALKTTVAAVRVNALLCFGELIGALDKHSVMEILQTIQRCTAVDRSAPTLMCSLGVGNAILKQFGVEFTAENVLPLLVPLLISQQLNVQQFAKYMLFVKDVLRKIEEKKGVMVSEGGASHDLPPSFPLNKSTQPVASANKNSKSSWDEDWGTTSKAPISAGPSAQSTKAVDPLSDFSWPPASQALSASASKGSGSLGQTVQPTKAVEPPLDFTWPPVQPSSQSQSVPISKGPVQPSSQGSTIEPTKSVDSVSDFAWPPQTLNKSQTSFDELDPFADWPPRSGSRGGVTNNGSNQNGWGVGMNPSNGNGDFVKIVNQSYGSGSVGSGGFAKNVMSSSAIKIAPPPTVGVGRGRGGISGYGKKQAEHPALLDLL